MTNFLVVISHPPSLRRIAERWCFSFDSAVTFARQVESEGKSARVLAYRAVEYPKASGRAVK